jgi:hypothetical protein
MSHNTTPHRVASQSSGHKYGFSNISNITGRSNQQRGAKATYSEFQGTRMINQLLGSVTK